MRFFIAIVVLLFVQQAYSQQCGYTYVPGSVKVFATGYKFTDKKGAKGEFKDIQIFSPPSAHSIDELILGTSIDIDVLKFDTGDPGRDTNIRDFFFRKMKGLKITGKVESINAAILKVRMTMNGVSKVIAFQWKVDGRKYIGTTDIDIIQTFKMQKVLDSLNRVCKDLHKGPDGISKTWSQVSLELNGEIAENCKGASPTKPGEAAQGSGPAAPQQSAPGGGTSGH